MGFLVSGKTHRIYRPARVRVAAKWRKWPVVESIGCTRTGLCILHCACPGASCPGRPLNSYSAITVLLEDSACILIRHALTPLFAPHEVEPPDIAPIAESLGLDLGAIDACLAGQTHAEQVQGDYR